MHVFANLKIVQVYDYATLNINDCLKIGHDNRRRLNLRHLVCLCIVSIQVD